MHTQSNTGKVQRCVRCRRRYRGQPKWNVTMKDGVPVEVTCVSCQTVEENAEAEINLATIDYDRMVSIDGRLHAPMKGGAR